MIGYVRRIGFISRKSPRIVMLTVFVKPGSNFFSIILKRKQKKKRVILEVFREPTRYDRDYEKIFEREFTPKKARKLWIGGLMEQGFKALGFDDYRYDCSIEDDKTLNRFLHEFDKFTA